MKTTPITMRETQVRALRREASEAGDIEQVVICDLALNKYDPREGLDAYDGLDAPRFRRGVLARLGLEASVQDAPDAEDERHECISVTEHSVSKSVESVAWAECARVIAEAETAS